MAPKEVLAILALKATLVFKVLLDLKEIPEFKVYLASRELLAIMAVLVLQGQLVLQVNKATLETPVVQVLQGLKEIWVYQVL